VKKRFIYRTGIGIAVLVAGFVFAGCSARDSGSPNIVVILADDLGWGDLGVYGATKIETPNCDRLAAAGIRFSDAHSPSAVCSPSRYGLLTGRYAWRTWLKNGILLEHMPLLIEPDRLTLPEMLRQHGYRTACVGKWHLGWGDEINADWDGEVSPGPLECGFDYFFGLPFSHASSAGQHAYVENRRIAGLKPGESMKDKQTQERLKRQWFLTATRLTEKAVEFIEDNRDQPFFLYLPTVNVHIPWTSALRFRGTSKAGAYGDFVVEFDWIVGEIVNTLEKCGLSDNTLIFVTSDNGNRQDRRMHKHNPNGPWRGTKGTLYEAGHRVPFLVQWPGRIKPGRISDETICLTDIMATCAELVGYRLPDTAAEDSYSLLPVLLAEDINGPIREATVHHSTIGTFAIRQGRWKLIEGPRGGDDEKPELWDTLRGEVESLPVRDPATGRFQDLWYDYRSGDIDPDLPPVQLFDLKADPFEKTNVYDEHPEVVERLQKLLDSYRDTGRSRR
jgi:arylsulfatase A